MKRRAARAFLWYRCPPDERPGWCTVLGGTDNTVLIRVISCFVSHLFLGPRLPAAPRLLVLLYGTLPSKHRSNVPTFALCPPTLTAYIAQKDAEGGGELILTLVGLAQACVLYDSTHATDNGSNTHTYQHKEMVTEKNGFLSYDVQLASFGGKTAVGTHTFPFSLMLPPDLPPSMQVRLNGSMRTLFCCFRLSTCALRLFQVHVWHVLRSVHPLAFVLLRLSQVLSWLNVRNLPRVPSPLCKQEDGSQGESCAIAYGFEVRWHRTGNLNCDIKAKSQLEVFSRPEKTVTAAPLLVGPATEAIYTCCCFDAGRSAVAILC